MKRFTFRLETLLKHREMLEDLRDQEFALAQGRHEAAKAQLATLEAHYQRTLAERPSLSTQAFGQAYGARAADGGQTWDARGDASFDAPALQSREKYVEALQFRIAEQAERVEVARLIVEEMRVAMIAAKQAREAVSRLRDKDFVDYQAEAQRKTQETLDEIASVRFARQQIEETLQRTETANRQRLRTEAHRPTDPSNGSNS